MRETLAAAVLQLAGYDGTQPLIDPMCGAGTFSPDFWTQLDPATCKIPISLL
ncbi:MAG: hypothetical protein P8X80_02395 [Desulfobacterales bacterium]